MFQLPKDALKILFPTNSAANKVRSIAALLEMLKHSVIGFSEPNKRGRPIIFHTLSKWIKTKSNKPRVLVLDNARIHRSNKMQEKLAEWEEKGFYIFHLPPFSPHLNITKILWRKIKYEWLNPKDYGSFETLTEAIKEILSKLGTEYKINFQDRICIK